MKETGKRSLFADMFHCGNVTTLNKSHFKKTVLSKTPRKRRERRLRTIADSQGSLHAIGFKLHLGLTQLDVIVFVYEDFLTSLK